MAFFGFLKMAAVCHLGFVIRLFGPPTKSIGGPCHFAKFAGIYAVLFIICIFQYFEH